MFFCFLPPGPDSAAAAATIIVAAILSSHQCQAHHHTLRIMQAGISVVLGIYILDSSAE